MISSNESFPFKCRIIAISFIDDKKEYQKIHKNEIKNIWLGI
jgi:hypothetical protein